MIDPVPYALLRSGLFSALPPEAFEELVRHSARVEVAEGEVVVREGDRPDAFYVVVSGAVHVYTHAADGAEVGLQDLKAGAHFGEQAALGGREGLRTASVRGSAPRSELVRVGLDRLDALFAHAPGMRHHLEALGKRQIEEKLSRQTELVRRLLAGIDARAETLDLQNGDVLYRQGDRPDGVYVVLTGAVELLEVRDGDPVRVALVGPGLCVGERDEDERAASAVIDGTTRVLKVPREALDLAAGSGAARDHVAALEKIWELPQRGFVTQYLGSIDGAPCLTQLFHLADGRAFVSSHVIGSDVVRLQATKGTPSRAFTTPDGALRVEVEADGRIHRIDARESRPVLAAVFSRAIEGEALLPAEEEALARAGELVREARVASDDDGFACACLRVTRARVRQAIGEGVTELEPLRQRTGCGMACGSCVPGLLELLGHTSFLPVVVTRRQALRPDVVRLFLAARSGEALPAAKPGQHVVLRARIGGRPVDRPYTLSGAAGGAWEITVKREPQGLFSSWLCAEGEAGAPLEASAPRGACVWDGGPAPVICLASGIGLTPALCFARTLLRRGAPQRLLIDWSTREEADRVLLGELTQAVATNLTIRTRITSRAGRIAADDVRALVRRFPTAVWFLCGSEGYLGAVEGWLAEAGVPRARVHVERFDPAAVAGALAGPGATPPGGPPPSWT